MLPIILLAGSLNLIDIILYQIFATPNCTLLLPFCIIFYISILAETNRTPFDLAESEAELVAGYNTEYSAITFALFFLGEYCNMIAMSALMVIFFFAGWYLPLPEKELFILVHRVFNLLVSESSFKHLYIVAHKPICIVFKYFFSYLFSVHFFYYLVFSIKTIVVCFVFVVVRAMLPRYRYDILMTKN